MKKYDYILAGGGCAGLSLVYHLLESRLKDSQILIIDPSQGEIPNKTGAIGARRHFPFIPSLLASLGTRSTSRMQISSLPSL